MSQDHALFRKAALDKLASPEQLDVMMQTTSPKGWMAISAIGGLLVLVILWGIFGKIGIKVQGQGILLRGDQVLAISATTNGQLDSVKVKPGDLVEVDQEVATLGQSGLQLKLDNQRQRLEDLERQDRAQTEREARNLEQSLAALEEEIRSVNSAIDDYRGQLEALAERIEIQKELVAKGLITRNTLLQTRQQYSSVQQARASSEVRLAQIASEQTSLRRQNLQAQDGRRKEMDEARRGLIELEAQQKNSIAIRSPYRGRVVEVTVDPGNLVASGQAIIKLEQDTGPLEAVVYVQAQEGKKIQPGMVVRISPSTVKAEEYGFMLGTVKTVSDFPVSPEALRRTLRNDTLSESLSGEQAQLAVVASLQPNPDRGEGFYMWSSGDGPPAEVFSGTIVSANVVVEDRQPISYVLPIVRKSLGL